MASIVVLDYPVRCGGADAGSQWTPSPSQIADLELRLGGLLQRELAGTDLEPQKYFRQYAGAAMRGRRVICVQGLHELVTGPLDQTGSPYRSEWMRGADGGKYVFEVQYDPARKSLEAFEFGS